MANSVCEVLLTEGRLEAPGKDVDVNAGAIVEFWGVVRELEEGRKIEGIDYEAHIAMAEHQLRLVAAAAAAEFRLKKVIVHHRVGFVPAGEASLFLQTSAPHRAAAFDASEWIVDQLKQKVPIWKRLRFKIESQPRPGSPIPATVTATAK
ncbi:MAG: molybdenum cofactor biosynthesis protein MoaE [Verrucomicrobiota bacterium]